METQQQNVLYSVFINTTKQHILEVFQFIDLFLHLIIAGKLIVTSYKELSYLVYVAIPTIKSQNL